MEKARINLEAKETGFSLDITGNVITIGLMIGSAIADIERKLPLPVKQVFREAIKDSYKKECEQDAETETVTGS